VMTRIRKSDSLSLRPHACRPLRRHLLRSPLNRVKKVNFPRSPRRRRYSPRVLMLALASPVQQQQVEVHSLVDMAQLFAAASGCEEG
jgi:hypothetical protein